MRLIDADILRECFKTYKESARLSQPCVIALIDEMPTVASKHGEWSEEYIDDAPPMFRRQFVCSVCRRGNTYGMSEYCPRCGAKMVNHGKH